MADLVRYIWLGGATQTTIAVAAELKAATNNARIAVSTSPGFASKVTTAALSTDDELWIKGKVTGLTPGTQYYARIEVDSVADTNYDDARFRTLVTGPHDFSFGAASCASTGSNAATFETIFGLDPDFFIHMGDLHYGDITTNNPVDFLSRFRSVLAAERQHNLWRKVPLHYMWDDHDYGPNNSGASNPSRSAALESYRRWVPHHNLPTGDSPDSSGAIYHSWVHGRVRFIASDLRSEKDATSLYPYGRTMSLGQEAWFKSECLAAQAEGQAICWICTYPWPGVHGVDPVDDGWSYYTNFRRDLSIWLQENRIFPRMFSVSGDMHRLAVASPDVTNYAPFPSMPGFPQFIAAALDRSVNLIKGGPYILGPTHNASPVRQFGLIHIEDGGGDAITVTFEGRDGNDGSIIWDTSYEIEVGTEPVSRASILRPEPEHLILWPEGALNDPDWEPTQPVDRAPVFQTQPTTSVQSGQGYIYQGSVSDPDGDAVSVQMIEGPDWLELTDHGGGSFTLEGTAPEVGA